MSCPEAGGADLSWLKDADDIPVMQTAIAVGTPGVLVTDNKKDSPMDEVRNGILIVSGNTFLDCLCLKFPEAKELVSSYVETHRQALREGKLPPYP